MKLRVLAVALLVCVLGACTSNDTGDEQSGSDGDTSAAEPVTGGTLAIAVDAEPSSFDPANGYLTMSTYLPASTILEALTYIDGDGQWQPFLAESIEPKNLASIWTITVRPGITFSNGEALDAEAVKTNLDALFGGIAATSLGPLVKDIVVIDDMVLEVQMIEPWASFPAVIAQQIGFMIAPSTVGTPEAATDPVGTGPFVMADWTRGSELQVTKNPDYWQEGQPYLDGIDFRILPDALSREQALAAGDVDMAYMNDASQIVAAQQDPDLQVVIDDGGDTQALSMNQAVEPFDNIDARKAVIHATDQQRIVETLGSGLLTVVEQPFASDSPYHVDDPHFDGFDLEQAKADVAAYEAETGKPLEVTYKTYATPTETELAQLMAEMWREAGIDVTVETYDFGTLTLDTVTGNYQIVLTQNYGYPDPDFDYTFWHSSMISDIGTLSVNLMHFSDPEMDEVLDVGRTNLLTDERVKAYQRASQILNEQYTTVWTYRIVVALVATNRVGGLDQPDVGIFGRITGKNWWGQIWLERA